jgi:ABC-2 type transport system permease protein
MNARTLPESQLQVHTSEPPRLLLRSRLSELIGSRETLARLARKEVKVKYTSSVLGAAWAMLNPILYLVVFTLVFDVVLKARLPNFPVYLLSGLLAWNLFATSLSMSARSVVDNASLVTKVYFPREYLPLSTVGAALVDFALQALVLVLFMLGSRTGVLGLNLLLIPLSMLALLAFTSAVGMVVASLNVRYRDTQHLLAVALMLWFWLTPIVYSSGQLQHRLANHSLFGISLFDVYLINPMADIIFGFQRALYGHVCVMFRGAQQCVLPNVGLGWLALLLGALCVGCLTLLYLAWRLFFRLSGDFAEEL